jgi:predicted GNAT family N-acyltransferase
MKISEISAQDDLYQEALELRYELFFKKHGLPKTILFDTLEEDSTHTVMTNESGLIAYGRLSEIESNEFTISQMVVRPTHQQKGYGSQLLVKIIQAALSKGAKKLTLEARLPAIPMYEKQGFMQNGNEYKSRSTGVPHINMVLYADTLQTL